MQNDGQLACDCDVRLFRSDATGKLGTSINLVI